MTSLSNPQANPFIAVLTDSGTWIFVIGAAAIASLLTWLVLRFTKTRPSNLVSVGASACPIAILVGVVVVTNVWQRQAASPIEFLIQPDVLFGLMIWFLSGWLAARAVSQRFARLISSDQTAVFE